MSSNTSYLKIFYFNRVRPYVWGVLLCLVFSSFLGQRIPKIVFSLSKNYGDRALYEETIWELFGLMVGIFFSRSFYQLFLNKYMQLIIENIRNICFSKWLNSYDSLIDGKSNEQKDAYPLGEVIARIMSDTQAIRELMTSGAMGIVMNIVFVGSCLIGFIQLDQFSGIIIGFAEVLASIGLIYVSKYMREVFHRVRAARGMVSRQVANAVGGVSENYFIAHGNYAQLSGERAYSDFMRKQLKSNFWDASYYSVAESLYPLLLVLVVFIAPHSNVVEGALIFAIVDLIQRSIEPIKNIAGKIANIQRAATGISRVQEFIIDTDKKMSSVNNVSDSKKEVLSMSVNIKQFSYPARGSEDEQYSFSLEGVHFNAIRGQLIGLVGISGCGKSTILKILSANIIPKNAEVICRLDGGEEIVFPGEKNRGIIPYRELVSIVSQDSHVFSESLYFNISLGLKPKEDFNEFWVWVKEQVPYLKKWGVDNSDEISVDSLSVGQKQLISALRACFLKKEIVFFDEISSALDSELELALRKLVLIIQSRSLTFIVAHRVETILKANKILVINEGKLVSEGTHEELLESSKHYLDFLGQLSASL